MDERNEFYIDQTVDAPVVRWNSNNSIPFEDKLNSFLKNGWITEQELENSIKQREIEVAESIRLYKEQRKTYVPTEEEKYELKSVFGIDEVIDIFTGEKIRW